MADATLTLEAQFIDHVSSSLQTVRSNMEKMELTIHESTGQIVRDIAKMNTEGGKGKDSFGGFAASIRNWAVGIGGAYIGFNALKGLITSSIGEAREAAQAHRDLATSIELSGRGADISVDSMYAFAGSLASVTDFQDDAIASAASLLLQFDNIGSESIPKLTEMAANLSKKFGVDLSTAATKLGRAFQDPEAGLGILNSQFRLFDNAQEESVRQMFKTGDGLGAQAKLMEALDARYKDFAKSVVDPFKQAQVAFSEAKEELGNALLPTLTTFTNYVAKEAVPAWIAWGHGGVGAIKSVWHALTSNDAIDKLEADGKRLGETIEALKHKAGAGDVRMADAALDLRPVPKEKTKEKTKNFGGPTPEERAKAEAEAMDFEAKAFQNQLTRDKKFNDAERKRADFVYGLKVENEQKMKDLESQAAEQKAMGIEEEGAREMELLQIKYDAMRQQYQGNAEQLNAVDAMRAEAVRQLEAKQAKSAEALTQKKMELGLQAAGATVQALSILAGKNKAFFAFEKSLALAEIILNTAKNVTASPILAPFYIALGAAQSAAVTATAVKGFARGTIGAPGGPAIVGENGPELIDLPRGSRVYNNTETRNMMGGSPINANFSVVINGSASASTVDKIREAGDAYFERLKELKRMNRDLTYLNIPET